MTPSSERAKLAGEVTEGDRALAVEQMGVVINWLRDGAGFNVSKKAKISLGDVFEKLIAAHRAAAVAEAESKVAALEALVVRLRGAIDSVHRNLTDLGDQQDSVKEYGFVAAEERSILKDALSLIPADLADFVCVKRSEWEGHATKEYKARLVRLIGRRGMEIAKLQIELEDARAIVINLDEEKKMNRELDKTANAAREAENKRLRDALVLVYDICSQELPNARVGTGAEVALRHAARKARQVLAALQPAPKV